MLDHGTKNHVHFFDHTRLSSNYHDYGVRARKKFDNSDNCRNWSSAVVVKASDAGTKMLGDIHDQDSSGACTPPLWSSPPRSPQQHHRQNNNYRCLSPAARTQAIARGQRELMEMVSRMPEGCYELSLRDIVEPQYKLAADHGQGNKQESFSKERGNDNNSINQENVQRKEKEQMILKKKKNEKKVQMMSRSGSIDNGGFLLKMVFPISWNSRKKKKNASSTHNSALNNNHKNNDNNINLKDVRFSPKPLLGDGSAKGGVVVDSAWWKKGESESGGFSSNSGSSKSSGSSSSRSSSTSSSRHGGVGCCPFIFARKGRRAE